MSTLLDYFTFGVESVHMEDGLLQIWLIDKTERIRMYDEHVICSRNFLMLRQDYLRSFRCKLSARY
jgi:hypothetical protein